STVVGRASFPIAPKSSPSTPVKWGRLEVPSTSIQSTPILGAKRRPMRIRPDPPVRRPGRPRRPPQVAATRRGAHPVTYQRMREFDARPAFRPRREGVANLLAIGIVL